jgi:hypothetical protein
VTAEDWIARQRVVCARFAAPFFSADPSLKLGLGRRFEAKCAIHGLRHPPEGDTSGWYIWTGDYLPDSDFFQPLHISHLADLAPTVLPYLGLPPGWRFLIAPGHEDVWEDHSLLQI